MLFSSMIFLWVFLPIVFIISRFLNTKTQNVFLLLASLIFYAWGEPYYVILMVAEIGINYLFGLSIERFPDRKKPLMALCVVADLGILSYYKYAGLIVRSFGLFTGISEADIPRIALPIGISFFTFQAMSYVADVYRGEVEAQKNVIDLALYISFFPQLIAGPIVKYKDISEMLKERNASWDKVSEGIRRFIYGLSKKVLISNILAACVDRIYALPNGEISGIMLWASLVIYGFQIYYDFSGYSDMAIGLGKMFGFDFRENFDYPYMSLSITEFWRRWHISLGSWFREYLYIPLGGSRKGTKRTLINLFIVFTLTGLWHGAEYNYILWGMYHGALTLIERAGLLKFLEKHKRIAFFYMFLANNTGWLIFRTEGIRRILSLLPVFVNPMTRGVYHYSLMEFADPRVIFTVIIAFIGSGYVQRLLKNTGAGERLRFSVLEVVYLAGLLLLSIAALAGNTYNPFIYFRF